MYLCSNNNVWVTSDGQLVRLALPAAKELDLNLFVLWTNTRNSVFWVLNPDTNGIIVPNWNWWDQGSLQRFVELVWEGQPVTTEWENVPVTTLRRLENLWLIVRPLANTIEMIQDRYTEKWLVKTAGWEPVPYRPVDTFDELRNSVWVLGLPCILKTRRMGYDGKWQWRITEETNLDAFWNENFKDGIPKWWLILEKMIDLDYELSVMVWMGAYNTMQMIGPIYNIHEWGTLRYSIDPAPIPEDVKIQVLQLAEKIANWVDTKGNTWYKWLLTIEFFVDKHGKIYVNEFAPRPHNSGHASLDSRDVNQNHLWLNGVAARRLDKVSEIQHPVVMENILAQSEFAQALDYLSRNSVADELTFYDYQKLIWTPDKNNSSVRKLWHFNHRWQVVEKLLERLNRGEIDMNYFIRSIRVIDQKSTIK